MWTFTYNIGMFRHSTVRHDSAQFQFILSLSRHPVLRFSCTSSKRFCLLPLLLPATKQSQNPSLPVPSIFFCPPVPYSLFLIPTATTFVFISLIKCVWFGRLDKHIGANFTLSNIYQHSHISLICKGKHGVKIKRWRHLTFLQTGNLHAGSGGDAIK